jgi:hypothetical protein
VALILGLGAVAWIALAPAPAPAQASADEPPDTGCTDPTPALALADMRWIGGG